MSADPGYYPQQSSYPWAGGPPYPAAQWQAPSHRPTPPQRYGPPQASPWGQDRTGQDDSGYVRSARERFGADESARDRPRHAATGQSTRDYVSDPRGTFPADQRGYARPAYPDSTPARPAYPDSTPPPRRPPAAGSYPSPTSAPAYPGVSAPPRSHQPTRGYPPPPYGPDAYARSAPPYSGAPYSGAPYSGAPYSGAPSYPDAGGYPGTGHPAPRPQEQSPYPARGGQPYDGRLGQWPASDLLSPAGAAPSDAYDDEPAGSNGLAVTALVFGFTPLVLFSLIFGILGVARAKVVRRGRGMAITAIVLSLAWVPVNYLGYRWVMKSVTTTVAAGSSPSPSITPSPSAPADAGCVAAESASLSFLTKLTADEKSGDTTRMIADFRAIATALNSAAVTTRKPGAATAMKKFATDITSIATSLANKKTPSTTVLDRLTPDGNAVDKACGHR